MGYKVNLNQHSQTMVWDKHHHWQLQETWNAFLHPIAQAEQNLNTVPCFGHTLQEGCMCTEGDKQNTERRMWTHKEELKELAFKPKKQSMKGRILLDCESVV